ncbi:glycosyltransferase family 2 protein [Saliphagus sp. GCM10025334]
MDATLSVVVSTLNDRERLLSCLDALDDRLPASSEVIVVNGPSSDGTTGAVRERDDVDVLVEISDRALNVSRNAGLEAATGDVVVFLTGEYVVEPGWYDALETAITGHAEVVTGPIRGQTDRGPRGTDSTSIVGRSVTLFEGANVAFDRTVLEDLDGFDEYVPTAGAQDCSHRLAGLGFDVTWLPEMAVRNEVGTDGGTPDRDWGDRYQSLGYRLTKNYGPRPTALGRLVCRAIADAASGARAIFSGEGTPTNWLGNGVDVLQGSARGLVDGFRARYDDRTPRRNPNGVSTRHDRAVRVYDRRSTDGENPDAAPE